MDYRARHPEKVQATRAKVIAKAKAASKFACVPCGRNFHDQCSLDIHKDRPTHKNKVTGSTKVLKRPGNNARQLADVAAKKYYCSTCKKACRESAALKKHNATPRHAAKVAAEVASQQASS